jgi:hypothetical protein
MEETLKEIAGLIHDGHSPDIPEALKKFMADAEALSPQQLALLAKTVHRTVSDPHDAAHLIFPLLFMAGEKDPGTALETVAATIRNADLFEHVFTTWAQRNAAEARAWYQRNASELQTIPGLEQIVARAFEPADPTQIRQFLQHAQTESGSEMHDGIVKYMQSPEACHQLMEAIGRIEDEKKRDHLLETVGKQAAGTMDPNALREFCAAAPLTDAGKLRLCTAAVTQSIDEHTPERAAWMFSLCPDNGAKVAAAASLTAEWARQDFNAAGNWINTLTNKEDLSVRDAAAAKFAEVVAPIEPSAAAAWAGNISDAALRQESLRRVLDAWSRKDRASAAAFVASKGLSQELLPADE